MRVDNIKITIFRMLNLTFLFFLVLDTLKKNHWVLRLLLISF